MVTSDRNGALVGAVQVFDGDEVMLVSDRGTLVRTRVDEVSVLGRNTQGVTLIKVADKEKLVGVERICDADEDDVGDEIAGENGEAAQASDAEGVMNVNKGDEE
jgi:DNA gyrase subunit A